jgi:hypothetical protein
MKQRLSVKFFKGVLGRKDERGGPVLHHISVDVSFEENSLWVRDEVVRDDAWS